MPVERYPVQFGDYRLLRKIAQGGMAEIFLAQDRRGQICAVKRILPHLAHQESFIRMFIDEARIVSHLDHPNIAGVYDQGKVEGYYFIAMEFVQGHSLLALSERAKSMRVPLPRGLLAYIVAELLGGLGCAHSARDGKGRHLGIVHRDVTPQNVIISYEGEVKLIDFGVAKARARLTQTEAGFTKGKLSYMSPEQARGEELDSRSDLFSVGIILYEITTNSRLFNKEGPGGILGAIVNDPIPPPSIKKKGYPKRLETIGMRALEKDVDRRWQSAEEMRDALLRFSRREQPPPGRQRLKDLVHDLFGDPDSAEVIEAAKATQAPTPENVEAHGFIKSAAVPIKGDTIGDEESSVRDERNEFLTNDETRMMRPEYELNPVRPAGSRVEITSAGTPIVELPIPQREVEVPEPEVPLRLQLARYLDALSTDLKVSYRANKRRYWLGGSGLFLLLFTATFGGLGGFGWLSDWVGGAAKTAREFKTSAGLSDTEFDAGLQPTVLRLRSEPPGAAIAVNGIGMGAVTPHELADLPTARELQIELTLGGYRTVRTEITLFANQGTKELTLTLEKQLGGIFCKSEPEGATISIGGKRRGVTPLSLPDLPAGKPVTIRFSKRGHQSKTMTVVVPDDSVRQIFAELEIDKKQIPRGRIAVKTRPSGCAVTIDGAPAGVSPLAGVSAAPGMHSVVVRCENYAEDRRTILVSSKETSTAEFTLRANAFGYLSIRPIPAAGSVVRINGKRVPLPVEFLKVVPGMHVVNIKNSALNLEREIRVDVKANARVNRRVNLVQ